MDDKISPRLVGLAMVLMFVALNIWGYYFYKKDVFGVGADIIPNSSPISTLENSDSVYMIPGI